MIAALAMMTMAGVSSVKAQTGTNIEIKTYDYAIKGNDTLKIDIYLREDLKEAENLPVMLYVHGGAFAMGSRKNAAQEVFLRHYVEQGYLGASIDYRLGGMAPTLSEKYGCKTTAESIHMATEDMAEATAWLLKNCPVDPTKIITAGGSAGAFIVLQIEYDLCNGAPYVKKYLPEGFNFAGIVSAAGAIYTDGSDLTWNMPPCPIQLLVGEKDHMVNEEAGLSWGLRLFCTMSLHKSLSEACVPHWLYVEKGADHVVAMKHLTDNLEETDKFIRTFINEKRQSNVVTEWQDAVPADMKDMDQMIKYVPLYILGYDMYLHEIDWNNVEKPTEIKY